MGKSEITGAGYMVSRGNGGGVGMAVEVLGEPSYEKKLKDQYLGQVVCSLISLQSDASPQEIISDASVFVEMMMGVK